MKPFIKAILARFDVGLYRISKSRPNAQGLAIVDPIHHNTAQRMDEFYSDSERVEDYINDTRVAFYRSVLEFIAAKNIAISGKHFADVGCGTGHLLKMVADRFPATQLAGFEYSMQALQIARTVCPEASLTSFDIYEGCNQEFDCVACTEVIEHLLYPSKALRNLTHMIAPGGSLFITVPEGRNDAFLGHINFWSPESWRIFVEENSQGLRFEAGLMNAGHNYALIQRES